MRAGPLVRTTDTLDGMAADEGVKVLVVEDAPEMAMLVKELLEDENFTVTAVGTGEEALESAAAIDPDVVILDISLPGIDGNEVCRRLRESSSDAYVIMLTARQEEADRLIGLAVGADDYVVKPFSPRELVARVRAMLRRPRTGTVGAGDDHRARRFGELEIDVEAREVRVAGAPIELSKTEFDLLDALSEQPKVSLSRDQLLERVWGPNWFGDDHVIDVHVSNLRQKLGDDPRTPRYLRTIRGFGYRMGEG
jgi:DNA-binding response OmpR family regulator